MKIISNVYLFSYKDILTGPLTPASKVDRLIEMAKRAGGQGNITAVLCEVAN
jgi:serine/threonine protein phosphatase PrpC